MNRTLTDIKSNLGNLIYGLLLLLISLKSLNFYILSNVNMLLLIIATLAISVFYIDLRTIKSIYVPTLILFVFYFLFNAVKSFSVGAIFPLLIYVPLFLIPDHRKSYICNIVINILATFIVVSLLCWILYLLGFNLNYVEIDTDGRVLKDYGLFLRNHELIPRFQSLFMEPGHLGTISALMVYIKKYNFKSFACLTFLLASLFSLSLASYLLLFIGFIIKILSSSDTKKRNILLYMIAFSFFIGILAYISYENQDSILYQKVFSRLEFKNGQMVGNNRYSRLFEAYYETRMQSLDITLLGMGEDFRFDSFPGNAGYKVYIIVNGIISGILLLLMYLSLTAPYKSFYIYGLLFLNFLSFLQRAYAHTYFFIILFILALPYIKAKSLKSV